VVKFKSFTQIFLRSTENNRHIYYCGISLFGAVFFNLIAVFYLGTLTAIAAMAILSFGLWYLLNEILLRNVIFISIKTIIWWIIVVISYVSAFLISVF
jgi:hypothetical protein